MSCRTFIQMADWKRIAAVDDCLPQTSLEIVVDGAVIALFNVDGQLFALDGICPHQGGPLGKGQLADTTITCPWHGWQFDVCSGKNGVNPAIVQPAYEVKVEQGEIYVRVVSSE